MQNSHALATTDAVAKAGVELIPLLRATCARSGISQLAKRKVSNYS
jgi:hypothetical protein